MNVTDLFTQLSYGELSNLSIGSEGSGEIEETKQPRILSYTNEGLLRLYSKFILRENDLVLQQHMHITEYFLQKQFALLSPPTSDPLDVKYILDYEANPFEDDLIRVLKLTNTENRKIPLNDSEHRDSFFTPQPNVLQIPYPVQDQLTIVTYQARHVVLTMADLEKDIILPPTLEGALQAYIAYKVFFHMNGQENRAIAEGHLANFNNVVGQIVEQDLVNSSMSGTGIKFAERGFV